MRARAGREHGRSAPRPRRPTWVDGAARLVLIAAALGGLACGGADPRARVLEQRARWEVQPLGWVENPDKTINFSTRVAGPPNSRIDRLTVAIDLLDSSETAIRRVWHTFDLTSIPRGGPKDIVIRIDPDGAEVANVGLAPVLAPTPEEERHIAELQDL